MSKNNLQAVKRRFEIIGNAPALDNALSTAVRVANTDLTVLITGESGVGKEVFSKIIHSLSARKHSKFIAINCGAIPEGTINSELFGHEKGAFTGASAERKGYFETVSGGTIFLDEIGEMPADTQAYLLRVLENGEFIRVGSSVTQSTDVRVIAATNVDLLERIRKGKFREDLYYRLNTVPIHVPSLKERRNDIPLLFRKFTVDFAEKYRTTPIKLDERAELVFENYSWPGNVRELKNVAEQLSVLSEDKIITAETLVEKLPNLLNRNLPASLAPNEESSNFQEREILYKLLFDMKNDLNDLKSLVFELINNNDLKIPNQQLKQLTSPGYSGSYPVYNHEARPNPNFNDEKHNPPTNGGVSIGDHRPILLDSQSSQEYENSEIIEESLKLADMEKDMILKALKKHNGKRKEAAKDLDISERTLYRKIKGYDIQI